MKHRERTMRFAAISCGYPSLGQHEQRFAVSVMEGSRRTPDYAKPTSQPNRTVWSNRDRARRSLRRHLPGAERVARSERSILPTATSKKPLAE
jgi:hypothetical protein